MVTFDDVCSAMDKGELFIEYLPVVKLRDHRCVGGEALVRWRRASGMVVQPAEFLHLVHNTPASGRLTYWVIDTVAAELGAWLGDHPEARISINVPPEVLGRGGLEYAATRSGLRARSDQIVLEITEHGVPDRLGLDALNAMAQRGVRVALDDVALNGVNLALLARCPFSIIKLDRGLTAQIKGGAPPPEWLGALASLLRNSSIQVVAEGVESLHQADVLLQAGVQYAQGYFFSTPLTARGLKSYFDLAAGEALH